jgi:hypothetical protein
MLNGEMRYVALHALYVLGEFGMRVISRNKSRLSIQCELEAHMLTLSLACLWLSTRLESMVMSGSMGISTVGEVN